MAELALKCLCDLLIFHPYFNFSKNIVHLLIPFLDNKKEDIRNKVADTFKEIFKTDKRGEISLDVSNCYFIYLVKFDLHQFFPADCSFYQQIR